MSSPFTWISPHCVGEMMPIFLLLTIVNMGFLLYFGIPLKTKCAPKGGRSYQFAWSQVKAEKILNSWDPNTKASARLWLWLDYPFIFNYTLFFGISCTFLAAKGFAPTLGNWLTWGALCAGLSDAIENVALLNMLIHGASESMAKMGTICAAIKYVLIGALVFYCLVGAGQVI